MWYAVVAVATTGLLIMTDRMVVMLALKNATKSLSNYSDFKEQFNSSVGQPILELDTLDDAEVFDEQRWNLSGYKLGDPCEDKCLENLTHAFCNRETKTCQCQTSHPIAFNDFICLAPVLLGETCEYTKSCLFYDHNSICVVVTQLNSKCSCRNNYRLVPNKAGGQRCALDVNALTDADIPSVFALGIGLALFTGLTCLVLRLFSRARFGQQRCRYANANLSPPIMMTGMSTPASIPASRRSSMRSGSTPGSRRPSYSMLVTPSRPGSRRPSVGSVRSQSSTRSYNQYERNHDPVRLTMSAPPIRHDLHSPSNNIRILEQKFAQHSGYHPRRETQEKFEKELRSRHSSFEIIADVISEVPEKT